MRIVNFKTLTISNFLSVGQKPVVLNFQPGINVITGTNHDKEDSKNGVGKSTIADALYFALFGNTIRELNKDLIVNSFTKKRCEVKLNLSIENSGTINEYVITRTLLPTKCFITKDGVDITHSTMAKTNEYIQKLIRSNGKIFQNSVIMTINNTVPFMAQTKVDKRKFIESILSLEVFSDMLSYARNEHNDLKRDYEVLFTKTQTLEKSFNLAKQQLDYFEDNKKSKITDIEKKIEENKEKILTLKKEIFDLPDNAETLLASKEANISDELKTIKESYNDTYKMLASIKSNINVLDDQLKEIEKVGSICTTCKRAYSDDDVKHKNDNITAINKKKEQFVVDRGSINNELTVIEEQQNKKEQELDDIKNKKTRIKELTNNNKHTLSKISYIEENITDLNTEKGNVGNQTNQELEKAVKEYGNDFTTSKDRLKHIDHDLAVLECVKFVVSEEGVKSYIVRKVLTVLNARLGYYLNALHANCLCQFNEYFDEVITDEKNEQKSYFNFSGGERKRIDLACLFAFLDVRRMQGDVHFSTIFYDELLDSSLDDKGVELVLKVLRERTLKYNENCYIITHRGNAINTQVDNTVLLEKRNGLTYLL